MTRDKQGRIQCTTILGRRFCSGCGKWRHALYFRPRRHRNGREYPQSPCDGCHNRREKHARKTMAGTRRARRQEYERIHKEALRRRRGVPAHPLKTKEGISTGALKPLEPVLPWLRDWLAKSSESEFLEATGVSDRVLRSWLTGERKSARLETLDQVFTRLGHPEMVAVYY